jgi:RNA polymerase sigma factor (sigma-70 family)
VDGELRDFMRLAQGGDEAAYRSLLAKIAEIVRRKLRADRPYLQAADVEDLVQDVLLSVHAARATYDPARPFLPWLMTILRFRVADAARRSVRRNKHEIGTAILPETSALAETNLFAEGFGDPQELAAAIAALPAGQRRAVELLKLREMTLKEAAAETGATETALKVAVHRAIKTLREMLNGEPVSWKRRS